MSARAGTPGTPSTPPAAPVAGTPSPRRIRVLIADDHVVVREGLSAIIGRQPDLSVVAEASDGSQAVELWRQHRPDIVLLDLRMSQLDGVGALQAIRAMEPEARVIILTTFDGDEDIYRGMRAGAKAYVLKTARRDELLHAIRTVHSGELFVPPAIAARLAERLQGEELTVRETDVLGLLAWGHSNKEIARLLSISETTVKTHLKHLFAKLNAISRTEAVAAATRRGIIHL